MLSLEQMAMKLKELGVPIWIIVGLMATPILVRAVGHFISAVLLGRAGARSEEAAAGQRASAFEELKGVVGELRGLLDECIDNHRQCEERLDAEAQARRELERRVAQLESTCRACRLTERLFGPGDGGDV